MLNFNEEHQSFDGSIRKQKGRRLKSLIASGILLTSVGLFSGCSVTIGFAKNVECDIGGLHAHNYVSEDSFSKFIVSEKEYVGDYYRCEEYINVNDNIADLIDYENKKGLLRISSNKKTIENIMEGHNDFLEYRYSYTYYYPMQTLMSDGKGGTITHTTYIPMEGHSWTTDKNHSRLTGETRVLHYMYCGYKIEINEKGKYQLVKSNYVSSLDELPDDYIYVKEKFYKTFIKGTDKEADYEDGPEEGRGDIFKDDQLEYQRHSSK